MSEKELLQLARKEVKQLATIMRLGNWEITVAVISALELKDSSAWAELWANIENYSAIMKLSQARWLYNVEWNEKEVWMLQQTIAHEFAHLYFYISRKFADEDYREEWMCEMIADAVTKAMEKREKVCH